MKKICSNENDDDNLEKLSSDLAQKSIGFVGADMKLLIHNFNRKILHSEKFKDVIKISLEEIKENFEIVLKTVCTNNLRKF